MQEQTLDKLFFYNYPENTEIEHVLVKVGTLNDFYSTNIFSVYTVANHIVVLRMDEHLKTGNITLVNDISNIQMDNGKQKNFFSFVTKIL